MITHETLLVEVDYFPGLWMRKAMIANALSIIGLHGGDRNTVDAFQRLLGPSVTGKYGIWPLDRPYNGTPYGGISTCAMVALGLLRRLGVDCADIRDGYHDDMGSGLNVAKSWAKRLSPPGWLRPSSGVLPEPGDIVQLLSPMHVLTVVDWEIAADGTPLCVSVDGGKEGLDRLQMIKRVRRPWVETPTGPRLGRREVDGWIDVDLLEYSGPVLVPEGWHDVTVPLTQARLRANA